MHTICRLGKLLFKLSYEFKTFLHALLYIHTIILFFYIQTTLYFPIKLDSEIK